MRTKRFTPARYYKGLSKTQKIRRWKEIQTGKKIGYKNPAAYRVFKTNKLAKTKPSNYTLQWNKLFPKAKSLKARSAVTGVPVSYLKESYDRGLAAYSTGHRPGATGQQWAYARVSSLLLCGKTSHTADADIVRRASAESPAARKWFAKCKTPK
jgi:hypothetical protein